MAPKPSRSRPDEEPAGSALQGEPGDVRRGALASAPAPSGPQPRPEESWELPDPVEAPTLGTITHALGRFSTALGIRPPGWVTLAVAIVAGLLGAILAWQELRLVALFAALLFVIALLFTIGRPKFEVAVKVDDTRVTVGDDAGGDVTVTNVAQRRNLPAQIELPIGEHRALFAVSSMAAGNSRDERFRIPTERRGVLAVGPARSVQGDPFGLTGRETNWTEVVEVFVHPRTVALAGRMVGFVHDLEGHTTPQTSSSDMSFQSLREYAPGDDRRQVHWRSSAHLGRMMVRQYDQTLQSRVALALDLTTSGYLGDEDFEDAVSVVASIAVQAVREENPLTLLTNDLLLPAVSGPRTLDELSRLERGGKLGVMNLARFVQRTDPQASVVILVTGAGTKLNDLRMACTVFDMDTRVVGIQVDPAQEVSVRNVANTSLVRLPRLAELPRAMRRAMP